MTTIRIIDGKITTVEASSVGRTFDGTLDPSKLMTYRRKEGKIALWHPDYNHSQFGKTLFVGELAAAQEIVDKVYAAWAHAHAE